MVEAIYSVQRGGLAERDGFPSLRDLAVQVFYSRRLLMGCVAAGLAAGLAAAAYNRASFTAESLLLVRADAGESVRDGVAGPASAISGEAVQRLLQSDIQILKSEPVVRAAAQALSTRADLAGFRKRLKLEALANSNIIRVAFDSPRRDEALRAVQGVIDAYRERRAALYRSDSQDLQSGEIDLSRRQIADLETRIQAVRERFGVLDIGQDIALAAIRLDALRQREAQAQERSATAGAELAATAAGLAHALPRVMDSQEASSAAPNDEARNTLLRLRQEREHLAAQYAPDFPGLQEVDRKIAIAAAQVAANAKDRFHSDRTVRNPVHDQLNARRAALLVEVQALGRQQGELARELSAATARTQALGEADRALRTLMRAREVAEGLHKQLTMARAGARLEAEAVDRRDGALRVVQPPTAPLRPRNLGPGFVLAGLLAGTGSGVAACGVAGLLRQVFLTPEAAERRLGVPVIGALSAQTPAARARLAAALADVTMDGAPVQVTQVAGIKPPTKSTVGLALAKALAERSAPGGRAPRILLADLDAEDRFRRLAVPGAARTLNLESGSLSVAPAAAPGVWVALDLAASPLGDPAVDTAVAKAFLTQLRTGFDWIVIVAEAEFANYEARRRFALADVNLVSIEAEATRAPAARALIETVLTSRGDLLGLVFVQRRFHIPKVLMRWL